MSTNEPKQPGNESSREDVQSTPYDTAPQADAPPQQDAPPPPTRAWEYVSKSAASTPRPIRPEPESQPTGRRALSDIDYAALEIMPIPRGFFAGLDFYIQNPEQLVVRIIRGTDLRRVATLCFLIGLINAAIYGAVMGANNLLQGSPMPIEHKLALIGVTAIKMPLLFLLTLLIVFPPIYVSNAFSGARLGFAQLGSAMLGAVAMAATLLASLASVAFFFSLTTESYHFIKLLHVAFCVYAGVTSLDFLVSILRSASSGTGRSTPKHLRIAWLLLYAFVGTQLAWVMRPFIASPNEPFQIVRPRSGSFYESVGDSTKSFLSGSREKLRETGAGERP